MRAIELRIGTAVAVLLLAAGMAGCTNSDPLNPAVSTIRVSVNVQNNATRFDFGQFTILQIEITPVDPQAQAASGDAPIGLFLSRPEVLITFETTGVQFTIDRPLATGTYRVDRIRISNIFLDDLDPPASSATCEEFVTFYQSAGNPELTDFGEDFFFTVDSQGTATLEITIDVQAFIAAFQSAFFCSQQGPDCPVAWCLLPFGEENEFPFTAQSPSFLDLQ